MSLETHDKGWTITVGFYPGILFGLENIRGRRVYHMGILSTICRLRIRNR